MGQSLLYPAQWPLVVALHCPHLLVHSLCLRSFLTRCYHKATPSSPIHSCFRLKLSSYKTHLISSPTKLPKNTKCFWNSLQATGYGIRMGLRGRGKAGNVWTLPVDITASSCLVTRESEEGCMLLPSPKATEWTSFTSVSSQFFCSSL